MKRSDVKVRVLSTKSIGGTFEGGHLELEIRLPSDYLSHVYRNKKDAVESLTKLRARVEEVLIALELELCCETLYP